MRYVDEQMDRQSSVQILTDRRNERLLESWCAARFSLGYGAHIDACRVEIEEEDKQRDYDFYLLTDEHRFPFQLVEVMDKGRRRGDEYKKKAREGVLEDRHSMPLVSLANGIERIREVLNKKVKKNYASPEGLHLLLYININVGGLQWNALNKELSVISSTFGSVWAVMDRMFTCIYSGSAWEQREGWMEIPA